MGGRSRDHSGGLYLSGQSAAWARCPRPLMHPVSQSKEELAGNAKKQPQEIWLGFIKAITSTVVKHAKSLGRRTRLQIHTKEAKCTPSHVSYPLAKETPKRNQTAYSILKWTPESTPQSTPQSTLKTTPTEHTKEHGNEHANEHTKEYPKECIRSNPKREPKTRT